MFDPIDFDPAMLAVWPLEPAPRAGAAEAVEGAEARQAVEALVLETKAAARPSPAEELQMLLNEMTLEMRRQFEVFRTIRAEAEAKLASGDEAEQKLAKADVKSATDALSLIVRTIEKIDSLQRSLAHDREMAAEEAFDQASYEAMLIDIDRKIGERAEERARLLMERWIAENVHGAGPPSVDAESGEIGATPEAG